MKYLRDKLGITQQQFADYLGLDRSSLTKHEGGLRKLRATAAEKLRKLEMLVSRKYDGNITPQATADLAKTAALEKKKIESEQLTCQLRAMHAEKELAAMRAGYSSAQESLKIIFGLLQQRFTGADGQNDKHCLQQMEKRALKKIKMNNLANQAVLKAKLYGYKKMARMMQLSKDFYGG